MAGHVPVAQAFLGLICLNAELGCWMLAKAQARDRQGLASTQSAYRGLRCVVRISATNLTPTSV